MDTFILTFDIEVESKHTVHDNRCKDANGKRAASGIEFLSRHATRASSPSPPHATLPTQLGPLTSADRGVLGRGGGGW